MSEERAMSGRRFPGLLLAVIGALFLVTGCGDDITQVLSGERGEFPSVNAFYSAHNHAPDGRAFTPSGQTVTDVRWFPNGGKQGEGILLVATTPGSFFRAEAGEGEGAGKFAAGISLWASYHRCGRFTPPCEIVGRNQDDDEFINIREACVLFLNGVQGRDGDALILFRRESEGDPSNEQPVDTDDDGQDDTVRQIDQGNDRLYSAYFEKDLSGRGLVTEGGVTFCYGFTTVAEFVDSDPNGDDEFNDQSVRSLGLVSDGLCLTVRFTSGGDDGDGDVCDEGLGTQSPSCKSGDDVSCVYAVWTQDAPETATEEPGSRIWHNRFPLDTASARFFDPAASQMLDPSTGAPNENDSVSTSFLVHNKLLLWTYTQQVLDSMGGFVRVNTVLQGTVFGTTGPVASQLLSRTNGTADLATDARGSVFAFGASPENLYGDDHGLGRFWVLFHENGFQEDQDDLATEQDVMASTLELDGTGPAVQEIDNSTGALAVDLGPPVVIPSEARAFGLQTRMNRCGSYIGVAWLQDHLNGQVPPPTLSPGDERPTRSAFARVANTASALSAALSPIARLNEELLNEPDPADEVQESSRGVSSVYFQHELAHGYASPRTAFQSNRFRFNLTFIQDNQQTDGPAGPPTPPLDDEDRDSIGLHTAFVAVDNPPDPTPTLTASSGTGSDVTVDTVDENWSGDFLRGHAALDDGNAGVVIYYVNQGNNKDDNNPSFPDPMDLSDVLGDFFESRLLAWRTGMATGAGVEISSSGDAVGSPNYFQVEGFCAGTTPCNSDCTRNPNWGGSTHHILIGEDYSNPGSEIVVAVHRLLDKNSTAAAFENEFTPPLADPPVPVDLDIAVGLEEDPIAITPQGDRVGLYIQQDGHLYYNEFNPGRGWRVKNGFSDPTIIDHDSAQAMEGVFDQDFGVLLSNPCHDCPTMRCTPVFWIKPDPYPDLDYRLYLRVHR